MRVQDHNNQTFEYCLHCKNIAHKGGNNQDSRSSRLYRPVTQISKDKLLIYSHLDTNLHPFPHRWLYRYNGSWAISQQNNRRKKWSSFFRWSRERRLTETVSNILLSIPMYLFG